MDSSPSNIISKYDNSKMLIEFLSYKTKICLKFSNTPKG